MIAFRRMSCASSYLVDLVEHLREVMDNQDIVGVICEPARCKGYDRCGLIIFICRKDDFAWLLGSPL